MASSQKAAAEASRSFFDLLSEFFNTYVLLRARPALAPAPAEPSEPSRPAPAPLQQQQSPEAAGFPWTCDACDVEFGSPQEQRENLICFYLNQQEISAKRLRQAGEQLQLAKQSKSPQAIEFYLSRQEIAAQTLRQAGEQLQLAERSIRDDSLPRQQREPDINLNQNFSSPQAIQLQARPPLPPLLPQQPHPLEIQQHLSYLQWLQQQNQPQTYPQSSIQLPTTMQFQDEVHVPQTQSLQEIVAQTLRQVDEQSQLANQSRQADTSSRQQREPYYNDLDQLSSSTEAIQSLLSDRDKLCELLEHHPVLVQMLRDRLNK